MGLDAEQVNVLKRCFDGFADEEGAIPAENVGNILSLMGLKVKPSALKDIIEEIDEDGVCDLIFTNARVHKFKYPGFLFQDPACSNLPSSVSWRPAS